MKSLLKSLIIASIGLFMLSCSTEKKFVTGQDQNADRVGHDVEVDLDNLDLASYLRRVPGVRVMGSGNNVRVTIRGGSNSINSPNEALFVVDGSPVGHSYTSVADMVSVVDIDNIEVLKGVDASAQYGLQGSNGVIVIKTKRDKKL